MESLLAGSEIVDVKGDAAIARLRNFESVTKNLYSNLREGTAQSSRSHSEFDNPKDWAYEKSLTNSPNPLDRITGLTKSLRGASHKSTIAASRMTGDWYKTLDIREEEYMDNLSDNSPWSSKHRSQQYITPRRSARESKTKSIGQQAVRSDSYHRNRFSLEPNEETDTNRDRTKSRAQGRSRALTLEL